MDQERELEQYFVARFSSEDKDELVRDLMSVAYTVRNADVYARVERVIERFRSSNRPYIIDSPDIPTWPSVYLTSIALAQLAARSFSDFVAIICDALPRQAADLGRRRASIVALAFGHLGLCKALLDNEEVPEFQRVARLFQSHSQFCPFSCVIYSLDTSEPPLKDELGHVMEAVVRGNSNRIAWALGRKTQPFYPKKKCHKQHLMSEKVEMTELLHRPSEDVCRCYNHVLASPLDVAIVQGHATVLEELLSCLPRCDPCWGHQPYFQQYSLRLACLRGDLQIFEMLLNVRNSAQSYIREEALQVISQYGRSEFLRQYAASKEYGFTQRTVGPNLKRCVKTAISHHQKEYLVNLFAEFEKYNLNLGSFPLIVLGTVLAEKSLPLLHSYVLACASFLARFPRPIRSEETWLLDKIDWPEGRAVLVDEGVLAGEKPRSLFMMCSAAVRGNLRHPITETAQQLPLPKKRKRCLLFKLDA